MMSTNSHIWCRVRIFWHCSIDNVFVFLYFGLFYVSIFTSLIKCKIDDYSRGNIIILKEETSLFVVANLINKNNT